MIGATSIFGMYMPWLMPIAGLTLLLMRFVRKGMAATGVYRWVWHPALFDTAVYVLMLYAMSSISPLLFRVSKTFL